MTEVKFTRSSGFVGHGRLQNTSAGLNRGRSLDSTAIKNRRKADLKDDITFAYGASIGPTSDMSEADEGKASGMVND